MRVVRFYVSCLLHSPRLRRTCTASARSQWSPAGPEQQAPDQSGPRRTSTASARSQWSPPDPKSKPGIKVVPTGPQLQALDPVVPAGREQQAPDQSGPRRTSTASARSQWSPPDPNSKPRIRVVPAGPRPQRISEDIYQIECQKECQSICMPESMSE